jgi:uncharacterized protein YjbJ (UPF0337 family)
MPVNWHVMKGKWTQLKGSARSQWGRLTDDEQSTTSRITSAGRDINETAH